VAVSESDQCKHSVLEIAVSAGLLCVLVLLAGNVFVLCENCAYNDKACKGAVLSAANALISGLGGNDVRKAALLGLNDNSGGGFCVDHPEFTKFRDVEEHGTRALEIQTRVLARLPAPFLIPNIKLEAGGRLPISRTYRLQIGPNKEGSR